MSTCGGYFNEARIEKNCGTGAGGFQEGNTCARGGDGGGEGPAGGGQAAGESKVPVKTKRPLTDQQQVVVESYQQGGYRDINAALQRGEEGGTWKSDIRAMDQAIAKSIVTQDTTVYRGTNHPTLGRLIDSGKADALVGRELSAPTFMSTSIHADVARGFGKHEETQVLYRIAVKRGATALDVAAASRSAINDEEGELLLPRNARMRITGVGKLGKTPILDMEFLHD